MPDGASHEPDEPAPAEAPDPAPAETPSEDWEKRFTYLYADFENYRRRTERERETLRRRSQAEVLRAVLPILEASERAVEAVEQLPPTDPVRRGVEMLQKAFATFLKDQGVHPVARPGGPFRPEEHEAIGETAPVAGAPDGTIATVVQQGYSFVGGLLRPAKVIVARKPAPPAAVPVAEEPTEDGADDLPFIG